MTLELQNPNVYLSLPNNIVMSYQLTVFLSNGDIAEQYTFKDYEGVKNNFKDLTSLGNLTELTCNVEVWKDEVHSETEYISIAKNFQEMDTCSVCGEPIPEGELRQDENENIVCEDCFIEHLVSNQNK